MEESYLFPRLISLLRLLLRRCLMLIHKPKNTILRIDEIWAFVSVDPEDNTEGIVGVPHVLGGTVPMIGADEARLKGLLEQVQWIANASGMEIKLIKLSTRTELESWTPEARK